MIPAGLSLGSLIPGLKSPPPVGITVRLPLAQLKALTAEHAIPGGLICLDDHDRHTMWTGGRWMVKADGHWTLV